MDRRETLLSLGVDLESVHFYRCRLDCVEPFPREVVMEKIWKLDALFQVAEAAQLACNEAAAEIHFLGVPVPVWDGGRNATTDGDLSGNGEGLRTFEWSPVSGAWGYTEPEGIYRKIIAEYVATPGPKDALKVWHMFLVAFEKQPERLLRLRGEGYFIEFRDAKGRLIRFRGNCLLGRYRPEVTRPIHEFMKQMSGG